MADKNYLVAYNGLSDKWDLPKEARMGIFDWLFKKKEAYMPRAGVIKASLQTVELSQSFMHVSSIDYGGLYRQSKSKKWAISWRDSDPNAGRGGQRESGLGEFVLADLASDVVTAHGKMQRPNNGSVADNGSFSLEDWHFGNTLSGTFSIFDSKGTPIVSKELTANILDSGISRNGKLAYCATANSKTEHSPRCQGSCRVLRFLKNIPGAASVWSCLSTQLNAKPHC